jgi:hypothetical protein
LGILNAMPVSLASWGLISFMVAAQPLKTWGVTAAPRGRMVRIGMKKRLFAGR